MVQQHGLHVKDGLARVEPLLPAPKNTTPSQTNAKTSPRSALFRDSAEPVSPRNPTDSAIFLSELWFHKKHKIPKPPLFCELLQRSETRPDAACGFLQT